MANKKLTELTDEQVKDFTALAEALECQAGVKEIKDDVAGKYKEWLDTWETQLREGVKIGNLRLKLKVSRQFVVEKA